MSSNISSTEIGLKFSLKDEAEGSAILNSDFIRNLTLNANIQETGMKAVYYDDEEKRLSSNLIGFRVRNEGGDVTATLKWSGQVCENGLSIRNELNIELSSEISDVSGFIPLIEDESIKEILIAGSFVPMFTTEFKRTLVTAAFGESLIEISFDIGSIYTQECSVPVSELECELKQGSESDLKQLGSELMSRFGLKPLAISKMQRGLELMKH